MFRSAILAIAALTLTGCASVIDGSKYPVSIHSNPEGAAFTVANQAGTVIHRGTTPTVVTLESGAGAFDAEEYKIAFTKEGYVPQTFELTPTMNGWMWGNLLIVGLIGSTIDLSTGAAWDLPPVATATLKPIEKQFSPPPTMSATTSASQTKEARIADLKNQNLSYAEYMEKHRTIMNE